MRFAPPEQGFCTLQAETFLCRLVEGHGYEPRVVITDKLASYPPAVRRVLPRTEHRRHKGLNNRAEHSHRPTRRRERVLQRFISPAHAQQVFAPFGPISDHFRPRRHLLPAPVYHLLLWAAGPLHDLTYGHGAACRGLSTPAAIHNALDCPSPLLTRSS